MQSRVYILIICGFVSGCSSVELADTKEYIPQDLTFSCQIDAGMRDDGDLYVASGGMARLPNELSDNSLAQRVNDALQEQVFTQRSMHNSPDGMSALERGILVYQPQGYDSQDTVNLTTSDIDRFARALSESALRGIDHINGGNGSGMSADNRRSILRIFFEYYKSYIGGEYITRFGAKLAKPEIGKTIGNDTISAVMIVFMEAWFDIALATPVVVKQDGEKKTYFPGQNANQPTSAKLGLVESVEISTDSRVCGLTEREALAISWLSNLAGDQSTITSGLILESFGGLELSFVLGGDFSVGDNQTLATISKVFVENAQKRTAEYAAYQFFWHLAYALGNAGVSDNSSEHLGDEMSDIAGPDLLLMNPISDGLVDRNPDPRTIAVLEFLARF